MKAVIEIERVLRSPDKSGYYGRTNTVIIQMI